jgi:hypothetical protein
VTRALATPIPVIDFRRHRMVLHWQTQDGTWTPSDEAVAIVHGIAMIRGTPPNVCLYALDGRLRLQIGLAQFALAENSPRIRCFADPASLGLRRKFIVESSTSGVLYRLAYWPGRGPDFFRWLAFKAQDPDWRAAAGRRWTEGVPADALRGG